ncbi:MAG: hypothetical protein AB7I96_13550 [Candidatus Dadabacteria bacterium]
MSFLDETVERFHTLQSHIQSTKDELANELGIDPSQNPVVAYNIMQNCLISTTEIMEFYRPAVHTALSDETDPLRVTRLNHNVSRIIEVQKLFYVNFLSVFEYHIKIYISNNPQVFTKMKARWIHLWDVMNKSKEDGLITEADFKLWEGANNLRRFIVHENSISNINAAYKYPKFEMIFTLDEPAGYGIGLIPDLFDWLIDAGADWILKFNKAVQSKN